MSYREGGVPGRGCAPTSPLPVRHTPYLTGGYLTGERRVCIDTLPVKYTHRTCMAYLTGRGACIHIDDLPCKIHVHSAVYKKQRVGHLNDRHPQTTVATPHTVPALACLPCFAVCNITQASRISPKWPLHSGLRRVQCRLPPCAHTGPIRRVIRSAGNLCL